MTWVCNAFESMLCLWFSCSIITHACVCQLIPMLLRERYYIYNYICIYIYKISECVFVCCLFQLVEHVSFHTQYLLFGGVML